MIKQTPVKILLLDTGKEWGGGTNSMLELVKRIDRHRFDIHCCFYHNYRQGNGITLAETLEKLNIPFILLPQPGQPRWAKITKELLRSLVFFSRTLRQKVTGYVDTIWRIRPAAMRIRQLIGSGKFAVLYMNNQPASNIEGYIAAGGLPVAVVQHCRIEPIMTPQLAQQVNARANRIIAVSDGVKRVLVANGVQTKTCAVVFNAIDTAQPKPDRVTMRQKLLGITDDTIVFGSIGSLIARKSHHHTLNALAKFAAAFPHARWLMVLLGEGHELSALQRQAQQAGIADRVTFAGFHSNVLDYLAAFDIFVLASKSEGLPRVILEAMLLETAVIGSRVTGTAELIEHEKTGLLYDYGDTDSLFDHIKTLYLNPATREALQTAACATVQQRYTIDHYISGVESVLTDAIKESVSDV